MKTKRNKNPPKTYATGYADACENWRIAMKDHTANLQKITVDSRAKKEVSDSTQYEVEIHNLAVEALQRMAKFKPANL